MRFEIRQSFRSPADNVDEAYADPDLYPTLTGLPNLGKIEVVSHERTDTAARLAVRFAFVREFSAGVAAVIDPQKLTWVQESVHDLANRTATFAFLPDHYADRMTASGRTAITAIGDASERTVSGELKVRAPLVGGRVEAAIVEGLEEYLAAEANAVDLYVSRR